VVAAHASPEEATELLVRRYLGGFGPARPNDIADWAGLKLTELKPVLERLQLRRFRDEAGRELVDLPRAPLPAAETPAPVRFLPIWDATLLTHARRTGILPEPYRPRVFDIKLPQSIGTFLVDGAVAGTWRPERGRIVTKPFARLSRETRRELDEEAERLAAFHA
jgi:Winged helix DNA-binding domain